MLYMSIQVPVSVTCVTVSTFACTIKHVSCYLLGTRVCGFRHVSVNESKFHGHMDSTSLVSEKDHIKYVSLDRA